MTANLYEKNERYHVMLNWYQDKKRKQKSIATGISVTGNNKRKAIDVRNSILAEWKEKITENYQDILFSDYLKRWLETVKHAIDETTYSSYKATIDNQICPYFAKHEIKLDELEPHHIQDFYTWKMNKAKRKVNANTIRHYHANIHKALGDAVRAKYIQRNPAGKEHITLPKVVPFKADFYTVEEMHTLLEAIKGHKIETPVYLASWFGLRRGELLGLRWQDIDFDTMTLSVNGVITDKGNDSRSENIKYRPRAKTATSLRTLPLTPEVSEFLLHLKNVQANNYKLAGNSYNTKWIDFICVDAIGDLIKPEYLSRAFRLFLIRNGLRHIRLHELRHSNASLLLDNGVDMRMLQLWLGHSNFNTTVGYAHHRVDRKRELGSVLSKALVPKPIPEIKPESRIIS